MSPQNVIDTILAVEDPQQMQDDVVSLIEENNPYQILLMLNKCSLQDGIIVSDGLLVEDIRK